MPMPSEGTIEKILMEAAEWPLQAYQRIMGKHGTSIFDKFAMPGAAVGAFIFFSSDAQSPLDYFVAYAAAGGVGIAANMLTDSPTKPVVGTGGKMY
jgi:hypothetical protein